ncbi:hypothetical protein LO762_28695 [Actinocorallia sp. API 0066]|uniref:hypothetical protein n=1 Tax=Actinocorallia sp. API 0066 TaxID=2896846 RepID=UPI001E3C288E|nr:hypothetical protein [Actinocorallia sp. API 0066]MCD0453130.1 hypothetical protein [Actinocorallia sp. API 0066]
MTTSRVVWAGAAVAGGLAVAGLGAWFVKLGLDDADKAASVMGAFVSLLGLVVSGWSVVLARRALAVTPPAPGPEPAPASEEPRVSALGAGTFAAKGSVRNSSTRVTRHSAAGAGSPPDAPAPAPEGISAYGLGAAAAGGDIDGVRIEVTDEGSGTP